ncbi:hypothetical protein GPJ56_000144 [Histomonas meleagridis]|uniref:uncharacterized protein n=1 Tax=Histomonas meleagridis TaxID=135588 RepID=UPI00355A0675|nr:hypothetical protein GPJ56_000144 [Histomonas meleagridis]KAH0805643.1 hypothetical protein GO595_001698 [Histomonas meleagridis]
MPRRTRLYLRNYTQRSLLPGKRNKYTNFIFIENSDAEFTSGATQWFTIVPPSTVRGMHQVKNITINIAYGNGASGTAPDNNMIRWAIVYVPARSVTCNLQFGTSETRS